MWKFDNYNLTKTKKIHDQQISPKIIIGTLNVSECGCSGSPNQYVIITLIWKLKID